MVYNKIRRYHPVYAVSYADEAAYVIDLRRELHKDFNKVLKDLDAGIIAEKIRGKRGVVQINIGPLYRDMQDFGYWIETTLMKEYKLRSFLRLYREYKEVYKRFKTSYKYYVDNLDRGMTFARPIETDGKTAAEVVDSVDSYVQIIRKDYKRRPIIKANTVGELLAGLAEFISLVAQCVDHIERYSYYHRLVVNS